MKTIATLIMLFALAFAATAAPLTWTAGNYNINLVSESASFANFNNLYWYQSGLPATKTLLFSGLDSAEASTAFAPATQWGLILIGPGGAFASEPAFTVDGQQHFQAAGNTISVEDLPSWIWWCSEPDYNDMVVQLSSVGVPEPGTLTLVMIGVALMAFGVRRRRA